MTTKSDQHGHDRCRALLTELLEYLDGDLTPARCRALDRHLAACTCCDTLFTNLRKAAALCRTEGCRQLPPAVRARARRRIDQLIAERSGATAPARRTTRRVKAR